VLEDKVEKGAAAVAGQLLNTYIRAVSVELKAREQLELIERLEALEGALERRRGGGVWPWGLKAGYSGWSSKLIRRW
jgi:hypothetical protein